MPATRTWASTSRSRPMPIETRRRVNDATSQTGDHQTLQHHPKFLFQLALFLDDCVKMLAASLI